MLFRAIEAVDAVGSIGAVDAGVASSVAKAAGDSVTVTATPFFQSLPLEPSPTLLVPTETILEAGRSSGVAVNQTIATVTNVTPSFTPIVTSSVTPSAVPLATSNIAPSFQPSAQLTQAGMQAAQATQGAGMQAAQAGGIALNIFELLLIVLGALALGASIVLFARARQRKVI